MIYLEMSRDESHGGGSWSFTNCVWAPTEKRGGGSWPFWTKVLQVREGDTIIHLRGKTPEAYFVGYSIASSNGFETKKRPPDPGEWGYANSFYRADLTGFTSFHQKISLSTVLKSKKTELEDYFYNNKSKKSGKANLFYVKQSKRLQCLNGAYLSDVDEDLFQILFALNGSQTFSSGHDNIISVETASQLSSVSSRLGQSKFSANINRLYGNKCCFPGCVVTDSRFLIAAHIARWSDNEGLRGHLGNGLCLCLVHDKAFEIGLFTLDENYCVFVNPREQKSDSLIIKDLLEHNGEKINLAEVLPLGSALAEHWERIGFKPQIVSNRN